jgi:transcription initiation factor TFIIB
MTDYLDLLNNFLENDNLNIIEKKVEISPEQEVKSQKDIAQCSNCGDENLIFDYSNGIIICSECGLVLQNIIDSGAEWRYYGNGDNKGSDPTRCGDPINPLLPKSSMSTFISGNSFGSIKKLHMWNQMPADERSLWLVFKKINAFTINSNLSTKLTDEAKLNYKKICEKDSNANVLTRGSIRDGLIAACIFVACKNNNQTRRVEEIAKMCNITPQEVSKGLKKFVEIEKQKNIKINVYKDNKIHEFIERYCKLLNIPYHYQKICHVIAERCNKIFILKSNTKPSICSGILFLISEMYNLNIKKIIIIQHIGVSEVTLNKIYKKLNIYKKILFIGLEDY